MQQGAKIVRPNLQSSGVFPMGMLQKRGPFRPSVIAGHLEVDRSAVSRLIALLDTLGLFERVADLADRRAFTVALVEDGRGRLERFFDEPDSPLRSILTSWDAGEIATLARLLTRLNDDAAVRRPGQ